MWLNYRYFLNAQRHGLLTKLKSEQMKTFYSENMDFNENENTQRREHLQQRDKLPIKNNSTGIKKS